MLDAKQQQHTITKRKEFRKTVEQRLQHLKRRPIVTTDERGLHP
jgi:hypothetical protein